LETPVNCHSELMEDSLGNIEPVQLGVEQMCQALVDFPVLLTTRAAAFSKRCNLSVMVLGDQHGIATVNTRCDEGMHDPADLPQTTVVAVFPGDVRLPPVTQSRAVTHFTSRCLVKSTT